MKLYRSYGDKLSPLLAEEAKDEEKPLIDVAALSEAYAALREMAESFDYDSTMYVLESLAEYRIPKEERGRYEKIREAIKAPDWEKLKELLDV